MGNKIYEAMKQDFIPMNFEDINFKLDLQNTNLYVWNKLCEHMYPRHEYPKQIIRTHRTEHTWGTNPNPQNTTLYSCSQLIKLTKQIFMYLKNIQTHGTNVYTSRSIKIILQNISSTLY